MSEAQIYDRCLTVHVYNWIENYRTLEREVYLEMQGGPILGHFIQIYGLDKVVSDFIAKTESER
jgi:hypothetical protein